RYHPRQEPSAVVPHAGICAGGSPRPVWTKVPTRPKGCPYRDRRCAEPYFREITLSNEPGPLCAGWPEIVRATLVRAVGDYDDRRLRRSHRRQAADPAVVRLAVFLGGWSAEPDPISDEVKRLSNTSDAETESSRRLWGP
ncbi:MAG: hypothetical protein WBP81_06830, partial [Solirubrobacteraceae bacterium]